MGDGSGGSKSIMHSGTAIIESAAKVIEKGKQLAGYVLEAAPADIAFEHGRFVIVGTDRTVSIMELAQKLHGDLKLPADAPQSLDVVHVSDGPGASTYPNGCHVAEVEIDQDTGIVEVVNFVAVDDVGRVINPMIVEGQVQGGVAQGIGQALLENGIYDQSGQLLSGSFMDYTMPRADNLPNITVGTESTLCTHNPLGVKGCGEVGAIGSPPAVINAIIDALKDYGVRHLDMPATGEKLWSIIRGNAPRMAAE